MLIDFKDEDFENKIKNENISVIQFSASWCSPCKELTPILEKLSKNFEGKATFYYADVEEGGLNKGSELGIKGIPTTILFRKGTEISRLVGGVSEAKVREFLNESI